MAEPRVLVTGAASGLGRAALRILGDVGVALRREEADVRDYDAVSSFVGSLGALNGLVHCAGIASTGGLESDTEDFREMLDVNVTGTFNVVKAFVEHTDSGSIVLVASRAGMGPRPKWLGYAASKAAVISLAGSLAAELAPLYRVHCMAPGPIASPMRSRLVQNEYAELLTPEDAARSAISLLHNPHRTDGAPVVVVQ